MFNRILLNSLMLDLVPLPVAGDPRGLQGRGKPLRILDVDRRPYSDGKSMPEFFQPLHTGMTEGMVLSDRQ